MKREDAYQLLQKKLKQKNLQKHCLAVEAVMRELAQELGADQQKWGLTGLLHDIDYQETSDNPDLHSQKGADYLKELGLSDEIVYAVRAHNPAHNLPLKTQLDKALYASDPLTGLIVAAALIHPEKKLSPLDTDFIMNRFGEKSFARGADREQIKTCSDLGLSLEEFVEIGLRAMQKNHQALGL